MRCIHQLIQRSGYSAYASHTPSNCKNQEDKSNKAKRNYKIRPSKRRISLKINKWSKDKPKDTKQAYERQKSKPEEKASHPAKEWIASHISPALWRPFFILRPPWRARTMSKARM